MNYFRNLSLNNINFQMVSLKYLYSVHYFKLIYCVDVYCSTYKNTNNRWNHNKDEYHSDEYQQKLEKMLDNTNNGQEEQKMLQRTIIHPKFKNIDYLGAQKLLADKPIGDFIFRPCRGKNDFLTLTWKVAEPNMLANILVEETVKKNASALGEVLMVENHTEKFDDLDEIAASVCSRLAHMAREVNFHKYYKSDVIFWILYYLILNCKFMKQI